jgi:hypothetical protein
MDVSCALSHVNITSDDEVGILLLDKNRMRGYEEMRLAKGGSARVGNKFYFSYNHFYVPVLPPIFSTYEDYANVTNIEESITTKLAEDIYGLPIQTILACVSNDNRELYNDYGPIFKNFKPENVEERENLSSLENRVKNLVSYGFSPLPDEDYDAEAYALGKFVLVKHKDENKWNVQNNEGDPCGTTFAVNDSTWRLCEEVYNRTNILVGYDSAYRATILKLYSMSAMFFLKEVYEDLKTDIVDNNTNSVWGAPSGFSENWEEFMSCFNPDYTPNNPYAFSFSIKAGALSPEGYRTQAASWHIDGVELLKKETAIDFQDYDRLHVYKDSNEFKSVVDLIQITSSLNIMFMPTTIGEDGGNDYEMEALLNATRKVVDERKARYADYYDED